MSAVLLNIVIGLATSVLSGGSVWTWQRVKNTRILHAKAAFFGLQPGKTCLIALNDHSDRPGATSHDDVFTVVEVVKLADEIGCPIDMIPAGQVRESNGDRTEFCIGGPLSNPRTSAYLAAHLPGVVIRPRDAKRDPLAGVIGDQRFRMNDQGRHNYALVARFTPAHASRPVIVIAGHHSICNRAAIHFLKREYRTLSKNLASLDRFCLMLRISSADAYGYQATELAADVTAAAFADHRRTPAPAGNASQN